MWFSRNRPDRTIVGADFLSSMAKPGWGWVIWACLSDLCNSIYLDAALVDRFKGMAGARGHQTLINETLKSSVQQADIAETLRQVIREEMRSQTAA